MHSIRVKNQLLMGYLLIAYIFVQAISGLLHVHVHDPAQEPEVSHHHYPVSSALGDAHSVTESSDGLVELQLQFEGVLGSKIFPMLLALLLFTLLLPLVIQTSTRLKIPTSFIPLPYRAQFRIPPLRAPPFHKI